MPRILVTGGAGFIGSHTVDLLLANNLQVVVLDNLVSGDVSYLDLNHPHLKFVKNDILDLPALQSEMRHCDAVLHLAALPSVTKSIENPIESLRVNMQGFIHVLQAVRELKRDIRVVYASSAAIYGDTATLPCNDDAPLSFTTLSPYALEKANNERYAALFANLFGIKTLGLRYFNVYGPRQDPNSPYAGVISKFVKQYRQHQPITIFGEGKQSRDFIHVSDIARANLQALQSQYCGVLNIATGQSETLLDLVSYIERLGELPAKLNFVPARTGDIPHSYAAIDKAARYLQFKSVISLQQGIQSLLEIRYD